MKFSIITPVYNSSLFLREAIESVLIQSYQDLELVLINDGSTDDSGLICDEYAEKDSRIHVIHDDNHGVSYARNKGLDNITGDWFLFLDADDILHPHALMRISEQISQNKQVDLIQFALVRYHFTAESIEDCGHIALDLSPIEYSKGRHYNVCAGGSAIRTRVVRENNIRFDTELRLAEDQVFIHQVITKSALCSLIPSALYYYRPNELSATHTPKTEYMIQTIRSLEMYKRDLPLAVTQFDNVIMSFIYYMVSDASCPRKLIFDMFEQVSVTSVGRCKRGPKVLYYLSRISIGLSISIIRAVKKLF